jgi:hypothetical protein
MTGYRNVSRNVAAGLLLGCLCACSAQIPLGADARERIASDLGLGAGQIIFEDRCVVGRAERGVAMQPRECVYIATAEYGALVDYDTTTGHFREALRIDERTPGIALVTGKTIFGQFAQMQVRSGDERYALEFVNADMGTIGHDRKLREAYAHLRSIGVAETDPLPYVQRRAEPAPIVIPIWVPR